MVWNWSIYLDNPNINFENLGEFTLICGMLTKIGTQKNSYEEFSALLNQYLPAIAFAVFSVAVLSVAIWEFWGMVAFAFCATFCWI